ncbi:MAG: pentapeptide repeat-containing protein [Moorea sp. SIO3G5]|nr:pentapeptide repeat-containing protein [Moorena sp. SIO3G5]
MQSTTYRNKKKFLEPVLDYLKRLALLEILELLGHISLLVGVIVFIAGEEDRRNSEIYQAWQVITAAHNQAGSGGRIQALEFLNSEPRRIPWFWLTWEKESLAGLEAPKADLIKVQLSDAYLFNANLQKAYLVEADLPGAYLVEAKLQGAKLQGANLRGANLQEANLQEANLQEANLQGTKLEQANLRGADFKNVLYSDETTLKAVCKKLDMDYPCPTIFPKYFDPKAAGMKLIKDLKDIPK